MILISKSKLLVIDLILIFPNMILEGFSILNLCNLKTQILLIIKNYLELFKSLLLVGDRSNQVQDGENNNNREQSSIPVSLEIYRNEGKDYLASRKQESQQSVTKRKKRVKKGKFLIVEKIHILYQLTLLHQQKTKRKEKVPDITIRRCRLP